MDCAEIHFPGGIVLRPAGKIDVSNADAFQDILSRAVSAEGGAKGAVIVDLSEVGYISSAGLRSLLVASKSAKVDGVKLGIAAMQSVVREIFAISRFDKFFLCFETVDAAKIKLGPAT